MDIEKRHRNDYVNVRIILLNLQSLADGYQWTVCGRCTVQLLAVLEWPSMVPLWMRSLSAPSTSVTTNETRTIAGGFYTDLIW